MLTVIMYLDGGRSHNGYKFTVSKNFSAWTAFRTIQGFRSFMKNYGLRFDTRHTKLVDLREEGKGRYIVARFFEKEVEQVYIWRTEDAHPKAKPIIQLVNGSYVQCYILDEGHKVTVWRPNPNAAIYKPLDYREMESLYG